MKERDWDLRDAQRALTRKTLNAEGEDFARHVTVLEITLACSS